MKAETDEAAIVLVEYLPGTKLYSSSVTLPPLFTEATHATWPEANQATEPTRGLLSTGTPTLIAAERQLAASPHWRPR